ncbi:MAG: (5-formylfuran-3-yl)methyl phosphate synthase [Methylovulum sp.]|nr:(5-formylfuran-3-yl)methyl phosphate synthase [Methylovulum sp.]
MTGMLASVSSVSEALLVLDAQVDIIDLKQPAAGALGALDIDVIRKIVEHCQGLRPVSATIGDLPMHPELIFNAVSSTAATGVDYIKIGIFPDGDALSTIEKLAVLTQQPLALVAVLFADQQPDFTLIDALKHAGFKGVMLDTMDKAKGPLTQIMPQTDIARFVRHAKERQLLCGLAGSLRLEDIAGLLPYQPDYLGFRGALCARHERVGLLDKAAVMRIKQAIGSRC